MNDLVVPSSNGTTDVPDAASVSLTDAHMLKLRPCVSHKSAGDTINSMDLSSKSDFLVTAHDDRSIQIFDLNTGKQAFSLVSRKYGVDHVKYTHSDYVVLVAAKTDGKVRKWDVQANKFECAFAPHPVEAVQDGFNAARNRVVSLDIHPTMDQCLVSTDDGFIRLYNIQDSANPYPLVKLRSQNDRAIVAFDPAGMVFAATRGFHKLYMHDSRRAEEGEFEVLKLDLTLSQIIEYVIFSPNGQRIVVGISDHTLFSICAFEGETNGRVNYIFDIMMPKSAWTAVPTCQPSISPDNQFVMSGAPDHSIHIWRASDGHLVRRMTEHPGSVRSVLFSRSKLVLASGGTALTLWLATGKENGATVEK
eukprot:GHVL01004001.1.p1 GENE.GHVL01004001.1~~GHVL01004001.1.p1  ORF type:complete len:363 (+),score=44.50 GHVL01004001.1:36-1124(+)